MLELNISSESPNIRISEYSNIRTFGPDIYRDSDLRKLGTSKSVSHSNLYWFGKVSFQNINTCIELEPD